MLWILSCRCERIAAWRHWLIFACRSSGKHTGVPVWTLYQLIAPLHWMRQSLPFLSPSVYQDSASCGGHSSSGSTSSLSTPPSVSQSPPQPQLNGVTTVGAAPAGLGGVTGLMGALGAGSTLGMGGIVGALNGVIQTPAGTSSSHAHTTGAATCITLPVNNKYVSSLLRFLSY